MSVVLVVTLRCRHAEAGWYRRCRQFTWPQGMPALTVLGLAIHCTVMDLPVLQWDKQLLEVQFVNLGDTDVAARKSCVAAQA